MSPALAFQPPLFGLYLNCGRGSSLPVALSIMPPYLGLIRTMPRISTN